MKKDIVRYIWLVLILLIAPSVIFVVSNGVFGNTKTAPIGSIISRGLERVFPESDKVYLKSGDFAYLQENYHLALQKYLKVDSQNKEVQFKKYHNQGNTYYRLGEQEPYNDGKIEYWKFSIESYQEALDIHFDEKTKANYDFVAEKLKDLLEQVQKQEEEQQQAQQPGDGAEPGDDTQEREDGGEEPGDDQSSPDTGEGDTPDENSRGEGNEGEEEGSGESDAIQPKGPSIKIDEQGSSTPLSPQERQEIQNYLDGLQKQEKQNMKLNNPQSQGDIFDLFDGGSFGFDDFTGGASGW